MDALLVSSILQGCRLRFGDLPKETLLGNRGHGVHTQGSGPKSQLAEVWSVRVMVEIKVLDSPRKVNL